MNIQAYQFYDFTLKNGSENASMFQVVKQGIWETLQSIYTIKLKIFVMLKFFLLDHFEFNFMFSNIETK